jgi:hypothetical protein
VETKQDSETHQIGIEHAHQELEKVVSIRNTNDVVEALVNDFLLRLRAAIKSNLFSVSDEPHVMASKLSFQSLSLNMQFGKRRHEQTNPLALLRKVQFSLQMKERERAK